jgi:Lysyl oxidase
LHDRSRTSSGPAERSSNAHRCSHQGISAGWGDQYNHATEGQELELTGQPPGIYYLVTTSNPDRNFLETDYLNNTAWTSFRLRRDSKGNPKVELVSHSPCAGTLCGAGPNR